VPRPWAGQSRDYSAAFFERGGCSVHPSRRQTTDINSP
jgi:hypothetical protein